MVRSHEAKTAPPVILATRFAVTASELACALGVSERLLRSLQAQIPHVWLGNRILFPVDAVHEWLKSEASRERDASGNIADEMLQEVASRC